MKAVSPLRLVLAIAVVVSSTLPMHAQDLDFQRLNVELLGIITNRNVGDAKLLEAISRLGRVTEPASVWTSIANDPSYRIDHRRRAVFALLRRHCHACWTCRELANAISPAEWALHSRIEKVPYVVGWLPIEVRPGETVFKVSVLSGPAFYVRLLGDVDTSVFSSFLRGRAQSLKSNPTIVQYAFEDDYDEWLFSQSNASGLLGPTPKEGKKRNASPASASHTNR